MIFFVGIRSYDLSGALASETYPSGRGLADTFDAAGRVIKVQGTLGGTKTYASNILYAPQGAVQSLPLGNGITETWSFSTLRQQPTSLTAGSALALGFYYCPNQQPSCTTNNGNILGATIASSGGVNASQAFGYDRVNRLTASNESGSWTRNYGYDEWGNGWVTLNSIVPLDPRTPLGFSNFDTNNRLNIDGAAYNAAGNQTAIAGYSNTYDAENRLLTSALGGVTTAYTYDGDGRRVQKATGGSTTVYVYDAQGQLAAEYDTPVPTALCTTCYLTADHLGSTRMMTDGTTGAPVAFHDYLAFGEEIEAGVGGRSSTYYPSGPLAINDDNTLKFTGKERDQETGLDYFGARYFASPQGRWTSPDWSAEPEPVPYAKLGDPQTLNLYAYVRNDPLFLRDLEGHCNVYELFAEMCEGSMEDQANAAAQRSQELSAQKQAQQKAYDPLKTGPEDPTNPALRRNS